MRRLLLVAICLIISMQPVLSVQPDELLADQALESRARSISAGLRCLVCQNQSIDDSDAPLARDLRIIVRERLKAGDSDKEVLDFVVARYGKFILLKPPFDAQTIMLWLLPVTILLVAAVVIIFRTRRRRVRADGDNYLSDDEQAQLSKILTKK